VASPVIGLEVPHAHLHLVPINSAGRFEFSPVAKLKLSEHQLKEAQQKIIEKLKG
jgi:histidine triad (HIT) family protein